MKENNFCVHPWVGLDISPQGEFRPCCKYENVIADNLSDYLNSADLKNLKEQFLNDEKPNGCARCWADETAGVPSKRQLDYKHVFNNQSPDLNSFKIISVSFGNTCNLSCRTCNSYASSKWSSDEKKLKKIFSDIVVFKHQKFYKDKIFINSIKEISNELIDVTFVGGETFISGLTEHLDFLNFLIETHPEKISLTYITNITTFPEDVFWDKWSKFKKINIQLSIDGTSDTFEYIRYPANWDQCYSNIKKYQEFQKKKNNLELSISHTISVFNVYNLPEFFLWCVKEKLPLPYLGMVFDPEYFSIRCLPIPVKNKIKERLTSTKFSGVVNYMMESNLDFTKTVQMIKEVDQLRGQNILDSAPWLEGYV